MTKYEMALELVHAGACDTLEDAYAFMEEMGVKVTHNVESVRL